ncbi:MAG TPA: FAD-linked oxidase C-terminal domain-containing protein [Trueperaceae bacterium]|nr:FAD-linked oxidase C-terminal domain-containing protein [Trueperaceae bacterium]
MNDLTSLLAGSLRRDQIDTSDSSRALFSRGESTAHTRLPDVVVYPESTADVSTVMKLAHANRVPVTPVGANSSLEGHTVPLQGGISLSMARMDAVLEIVAPDFLAVVQPGVTYPRLNEALRPTGLFFPVDPGAEASIGGMASTNASGTLAVRYGVTSDQVMALEVVMADGSVIRTGGRSRKSSSGYQLTRLFCGAEGTLGIITELTVRLTPRPTHVMGARASFPDVSTCVGYVTELVQSGAVLARCELVDAPSIGAINAHLGLDLEVAPTVFLEFHGDEHTTAMGVAAALDLARDYGAGSTGAARDGDELRSLWRARHQAFYCLTAAHPGMSNLITDLAVPVSRLADVIDASVRLTTAAGLPTYVLGHVGDGNFHLTLFYPPTDELAEAAAMSAHSELVALTLAAGGTCTGEHGIGFRKLPYVRAEHGDAVEVMWAVKQALDPLGILNPGKKLPPRG